MLQVTGHAGGVPIASPRGRSVEVPFGREVYLFTLLYFNWHVDRIDLPHGHFVVIFTSDSLTVANIQMVSLLNSVLKHTSVFGL